MLDVDKQILMKIGSCKLIRQGGGKQFYMLDKYQHFKKLSKTVGCSFYDAEDRTTMQNVLLKRLQQRSSWDQLLTNRNLQFMSKSKIAPKMLQIFKKKGYYFIVFQKPTGPPLSEPEQIGKLPLNRFYPLFYDLCKSCVDLKQHSPQMYILPEWVFINRNSVRIGHFEPFFSSEGEDGNKHVFMYNLQKSIQTNTKALAQSDVLSFERRQSLIYNLGAIAYQLIIGKKATTAVTEEEYAAQIAQLEAEVFKKIQRATKDEKLAEMITKMIKQDPFDCPTLTQVFNFVKRKNNEYEPRNTINPTVEFDMEKIQLTDKYNSSPGSNRKKFTRPCCKTTENEEVDVELEKRGNLTLAYVKREAHNHTRNRSFLPEITYSRRYKSKDTFGSRPTMLRSEGDLRFKEL